MSTVEELAKEILLAIEQEDKEHDFKKGGMYREKKKAADYQSTH